MSQTVLSPDALPCRIRPSRVRGEGLGSDNPAALTARAQQRIHPCWSQRSDQAGSVSKHEFEPLRGHSRSNRDSTYRGDDFRVEPLHQKNCLGAMGLTLKSMGVENSVYRSHGFLDRHAQWMGSQWRYTIEMLSRHRVRSPPRRQRMQPSPARLSELHGLGVVGLHRSWWPRRETCLSVEQ